MTKNRRTFQEPKQQLKFAVLFFTMLTTCFAGFMIMTIRTVVMSLDYMKETNPSATTEVEGTLRTLTIMLIVIAVSSCFMIVLGLLSSYVLTQRLFGPVIPIKNLIQKLKDGDYKARGSLRKHDEFQDVMEELNQLAANLEERAQKI